MSNCELCNSTENITLYEVEPQDDTISICSTCKASLEEPSKNEKHWNCLHDSMWSTKPAVQVVVYRLLSKLGAQDQLDMLYLDEDTKEWAEKDFGDNEVKPVTDANGTILEAGDSVSIIKDLPVKGAGFTAKQGTTVKNIRMVADDPAHIQGRVNGSMIFIISEFVKKI